MVSNADPVEWMRELTKIADEGTRVPQPDAPTPTPAELAYSGLEAASMIAQARDIKSIGKFMPRVERLKLAALFASVAHELKHAEQWLRREMPEPEFIPAYLKEDAPIQSRRTR